MAPGAIHSGGPPQAARRIFVARFRYRAKLASTWLKPVGANHKIAFYEGIHFRLFQAFENQVPIIYFLGIAPGRYQAILARARAFGCRASQAHLMVIHCS